MLVSLFTECGAALAVPEGMRNAALEMASNATTRDMAREYVSCELDSHRYGDHGALLLDLEAEQGDGDVWVTWDADGSDIAVRIRPYCPSKSPSKEDACWLYDAHRGGHTWERYE